MENKNELVSENNIITTRNLVSKMKEQFEVVKILDNQCKTSLKDQFITVFNTLLEQAINNLMPKQEVIVIDFVYNRSHVYLKKMNHYDTKVGINVIEFREFIKDYCKKNGLYSTVDWQLQEPNADYASTYSVYIYINGTPKWFRKD